MEELDEQCKFLDFYYKEHKRSVTFSSTCFLKLTVPKEININYKAFAFNVHIQAFAMNCNWKTRLSVLTKVFFLFSSKSYMYFRNRKDFNATQIK